MGSSPLGEIGKALKIGATVYGMEKSGLIKYLDELGVKQKNGGFSFENKKDTPIPGAVPPIDQVPQAGGPMTYGNQEAQAPIAGAVAPTSQPMGGPLGSSYDPKTGQQMYGDTGLNKNYSPPNLSSDVQMGLPLTGKSILGDSVMKNPDDFNPAEGNYGYTQQLASGNEYTQQPGYGQTAGMMKSMFGLA
jgi:hypothetical protein